MDTAAPEAQKGSIGPVSLDVRQVVEGLEDGVMLTEEGRVTGANRALGRMLGLDAKDLVGRRTAEFLCDTEGRPLHELARSDAVRVRDARGGLVPVVLRELGPGMFLVADRSRESRLEDEVWRLSRQLRRVGEGGCLPEVLQGEIAAMIEHETRTASTAIRGYLRMLLDGRAGDITPTQSSYLLESLRASERVQELLDNLLEMTTPDDPSALRIIRKPERLHAIVNAARATVRPFLEQRDVRLDLELDVEGDEILADAARLEQVIVNLVTNAVKFGPRNARIGLATRLVELDGGQWLSLSVEDEGPGIHPEEAARIFEPFIRGRLAADGQGGGVGLGLAICRKIVEAHGGTIEAVPSLGHGLFRILLPLGM
jgi:signal transduction histidine kinase